MHIWIHRTIGLLTDALFPRASHCLCCGHPRRASQEDCLCPDCRREIENRRVPASSCDRCLSPVKKNMPCAFCKSSAMAHIERVYAPYRYAGEVRQLVHAFKFDACGEALPLLSAAMADSLTRRDFDCIVPVPLHKKRLRQRGFDQTMELARAVGARTGIPVEQLLERKQYQRPQSRTPVRDRQKNVAGAFAAADGAAGKRILLLDDVRTTGSTAAECAKELMKAGAKSVCLLVCAVVYRKA